MHLVLYQTTFNTKIAQDNKHRSIPENFTTHQIIVEL